jgi:hypothetical protein
MAMSTVVDASSALERCIKIDASDDGMFIPRPTITLKVEGTSLQLYPPADPSWKTAEKDYAFKVNVSACERACLTPLTSITHVFHQMGMTTQGNMEVATWTNPLEDHWANPSSVLMHILGSLIAVAIAFTTQKMPTDPSKILVTVYPWMICVLQTSTSLLFASTTTTVI